MDLDLDWDLDLDLNLGPGWNQGSSCAHLNAIINRYIYAYINIFA